MITDFYDATIKAYRALRKSINSANHNVPIHDTALNHKFFDWQMEVSVCFCYCDLHSNIDIKDFRLNSPHPHS